jgi:hypothetical protein
MREAAAMVEEIPAAVMAAVAMAAAIESEDQPRNK